MRSSNILEVWSFRRTEDESCLVCSTRSKRNPGFCKHGTPAHINDQRALDSRLDLFDQNGRRTGRMPDLVLRSGAAAISTTDDPGPDAFRAIFNEPMDRFSIYLLNTKAVQGQTPGAKPGQMALQVRIGVECIEEPAVTFLFTPGAFGAGGGHLVTFATAQLFTSLVILGVTVEGRTPVPAQTVGLVVDLHNSGMCCGTSNPIFGPLVDKPPAG